MSGFEVSKRGVYLTSVRKTERGWIIRLWNQTGKTDKVTLKLPEALNVHQLQELELRDRPLNKAPYKVHQHQVELEVSANHPLTLLLKQ